MVVVVSRGQWRAQFIILCWGAACKVLADRRDGHAANTHSYTSKQKYLIRFLSYLHFFAPLPAVSSVDTIDYVER